MPTTQGKWQSSLEAREPTKDEASHPLLAESAGDVGEGRAQSKGRGRSEKRLKADSALHTHTDPVSRGQKPRGTEHSGKDSNRTLAEH